jgi:8-oxo-dGTP pyrophosphatase MutT (NUDIX family)
MSKKSMHKTLKKKVVIYCVRNDHLLVFRHVDYAYEQVGIQVPAGTVEDNEDIEHAALRELCEETNQTCFMIDRFLGQDIYDISPLRLERQERHFFVAHPTGPLPDRWPSFENHDGLTTPTRFECFWVPLAHAHVLQSGQSNFIWKLVDDHA